jgi:hypothetical protein
MDLAFWVLCAVSAWAWTGVTFSIMEFRLESWLQRRLPEKEQIIIVSHTKPLNWQVRVFRWDDTHREVHTSAEGLYPRQRLLAQLLLLM